MIVKKSDCTNDVLYIWFETCIPCRFLFENVWIAAQACNPPGPTPIKTVHYLAKNLGEHTGTIHSIDCKGTWVVSGSGTCRQNLPSRKKKKKKKLKVCNFVFSEKDFFLFFSVSFFFFFSFSFFVCNSGDKTIRLWDRSGRRSWIKYEVHGDAVKCVRFDRFAPLHRSHNQQKVFLKKIRA